MQKRVRRLPIDETLRALTIRMPLEVKEPLTVAAKERNVSIARLLTHLAADYLHIDGYDLPDEKLNT